MKIPLTPPNLTAEANNHTGTDKHVDMMQRLITLMSSDHGKDRDYDYLHWDNLRFKPLPEGIENHKEWWFLTKLRRMGAYRKLPFKAINKEPFVYWLPDALHKMLHQIDKQASGQVQIAKQVANPNTRDRYLISSLMEEAITSSQLEGASTTYKVAKNMLRESRKPLNKSEQMIFNNYQAMRFIRDVSKEKLTPQLILELHKIVTEKTLEKSDAAGRYRLDNEEIAVYDDRDNVKLHTPPPASELKKRIQLICDFANNNDDKAEFLHPVVKSIILHFMMGYDHPFVDGNGRTARALFYWSMSHQNYWMMEYISISKIFREAPVQYAKSFLYSETDDFDLTYFIDYNLKTILRAIKTLQNYLAKKANEISQVESNIHNSVLAKQFNYRQLALISHALRNPDASYTIESHRKSHNITYPTARADLYKLSELGVLNKVKIKRAFVFSPVNNLHNHLESLQKPK